MRLMDLPDEVHLAIQSHMPISTLLTARAVCRLWKSLIPGSHIPPARLRLLNLYLHLIQLPVFHATRKDTLQRLQPFDRERALRLISKGGIELPEEFRLWILEWPERAAFAGIWPGLGGLKELPCSDEALSPIEPTRGTSLLSASGPYILRQLEVTAQPDPEHATEIQVSPPWVTVPPAKRAVALVLDDAYVKGWQRSNMLVLSAPTSSQELVGRVYQVDGLQTRADGVFVNSWVDYLSQELAKEEGCMRAQPGQ